MGAKILDLTDRSPRKSPKFFLPAIIQGMLVTARHFLRNLAAIKSMPTILYPEQRRKYSERFRGKHILKTRDDGTLKCVACYMCAQACPADCIEIIAGEHPKIAYEKYPVVFNIDMLRCVMCGLCVDACPKDAIWMSGNYELTFLTRHESVFDIKALAEVKGVPVKDGYGYRPYYPGDGTVPPTDASVALVVPGDGERMEMREGRLPSAH
jgi:NADH-quinone oxidoreductase subunit I